MHEGRKVTIRGNRFSGIGRLAFLQIFRRRCEAVGVDLRYHVNVTEPQGLAEADLLVGADGANSIVRQHDERFFRPSIRPTPERVHLARDAPAVSRPTLTFRRAAAGVFAAHSYMFNASTSTFIVECPPETWERAGFAAMDEAATCRYLEDVFAPDLEGRPLLTNNFVRWLNFPLVRNERWHHGRVVLLGDALHTAHFSIGSGTKLALEDAIALAQAFDREREVGAALAEFERARKPWWTRCSRPPTRAWCASSRWKRTCGSIRSRSPTG